MPNSVVLEMIAITHKYNSSVIILMLTMPFLLIGCGGGVAVSNQAKSIIPEPINLGQTCKYVGENRFFTSFDVFCSLEDFESYYPNSRVNNYYSRLGERDILIAPFIGATFIDQSYRIVNKLQLVDIFYNIMGGKDYKARTEDLVNLEVACKSSALVFSVETLYSGKQGLYEYCNNYLKRPNLVAIYLEGHGGGANEIGVDHMDFLASKGYRVFYSDMPLVGSNKNNLTITHNDLGSYEQNHTGISPILSEFIYPIGRFVDYIYRNSNNNNKELSLTLFGRSGGGWRSYVAGALYDVDYVISVAGGTPHSMRLSAPWTVYELGDWEQYSPTLYSIIGHEDFMRFSGTKGSAFIFNLNDPCCFRVSSSDPFHMWLKKVSPQYVDVYVDENNYNHSLGDDGKQFLTNILNRWAN